MDPLTITLAVITVSSKCVVTARAAYSLREKYKNLESTLTAIHNKSMVISASLGSIQTLITQNPDINKVITASGLEDTIDRAITGCSVAYLALEEEISKAQAASTTAVGKAKVLWQEKGVKEIENQLDGQKVALDCVVQALQLYVTHLAYVYCC
jgi:hypothetical protein